jgi:hypothetical protein
LPNRLGVIVIVAMAVIIVSDSLFCGVLELKNVSLSR